MGTAANRLEEISSSIMPTDKEIQNARDRVQEVRDKIENGLDCKTYISGSYKKFTGVSPLNDVDLFIWFSKPTLRANTLKELKTINPQNGLNRLKSRIKKLEIPHFQIRLQDHSLGLKYEGIDFTIDLIPAFSADDPKNSSNFDRLFHIPEVSTDNWIKTEPESDQRRLAKLNNENKKKLNKIIRLF